MLAGLLLHRVRCGGAAWRRLALPETSRMSTDAARRDEERVGKSATRRRRATLPTRWTRWICYVTCDMAEHDVRVRRARRPAM